MKAKNENLRQRAAYEVNVRRPSVMWLAQQTHGQGSEDLRRNTKTFILVKSLCPKSSNNMTSNKFKEH